MSICRCRPWHVNGHTEAQNGKSEPAPLQQQHLCRAKMLHQHHHHTSPRRAVRFTTIQQFRVSHYIMLLFISLLSWASYFGVNLIQQWGNLRIIEVRQFCADTKILTIMMHSPGSVARSQTSFTDSIVRSLGAWSTIVVDPTMQSTHPTIPRKCNRSLRITCAKAALHTKNKTPNP